MNREERRQLMRDIERAQKEERIRRLKEKAGIMVHGAMKYKCRKCGYEWWMFLEKGLEDEGADVPHKPVPFAITCGKCHDIAYDISFYVEIPEEGRYHPLPEGESYFANYKTRDCGVPVLAPKDR